MSKKRKTPSEEVVSNYLESLIEVLAVFPAMKTLLRSRFNARFLVKNKFNKSYSSYVRKMNGPVSQSTPVPFPSDCTIIALIDRKARVSFIFAEVDSKLVAADDVKKILIALKYDLRDTLPMLVTNVNVTVDYLANVGDDYTVIGELCAVWKVRSAHYFAFVD